MELTLQNIGIINNAEIDLNGLTVICGTNNSGKSTAGKALYAAIESLNNIDAKFHEELMLNFRRTLLSISRILDLESIIRYIDLKKMTSRYDIQLERLITSPLRYRDIKEDTTAMLDEIKSMRFALENLNAQILLDCATKSKSELPKRVIAYLNNFDEEKEKALSLIGDMSRFSFENDLKGFAEKSLSSLLSKEFNGQIFPINLKTREKKSYIRLTKNEEMGLDATIIEKKDISVTIKSDYKLFVSNAIYIEDPYILDKLSVYDDDEFLSMYRYQIGINRFDYSHNSKLNRLLMKKSATSLIERSINEAKYNQIIKKINEVIPGTITKKENGFYYEEPNKMPLKVQNLATGAKMFSIIRNLIEKGEVNFDTVLILDEPEAHLHPEWQNIFAEIIVLLIKELNTTVLLTTHSPTFLMALEAYSKRYQLRERAAFYISKHNENNYTVNYENVSGRVSEIYSTFAIPLIQSKKLKDN